MNINWKIFRLSSLFLLTIVTVNSQSINSLLINDGPYIFIEQDGLTEKSVVDGEVVLKKYLLTHTKLHLLLKIQHTRIKKKSSL
jgi:hypothetical protein